MEKKKNKKKKKKQNKKKKKKKKKTDDTSTFSERTTNVYPSINVDEAKICAITKNWG